MENVRNYVIVRDDGCDLGCLDRRITGRIYIHHINPITKEDIINGNFSKLLDPDNLICVSMETHNAIHYGSFDNLPKDNIIERKPNDTCPWKN